MGSLDAQLSYHGRAAALFDAIPEATDPEGCAAAISAVCALWESRGAYGCEVEYRTAAIRRVTDRMLYPHKYDPTHPHYRVVAS